MKALFFDTETTGKPKNYNARTDDLENWPRMVQLAYIVVDNEETILEIDRIVKPDGFIIPEEASKIHGINQSYAEAEGIGLEYVIAEFVENLENVDYIIGHNVSFDFNVVGAECLRVGYDYNPLVDYKLYCTMKQLTSFCKIPGQRGYKWPKLSELHEIIFGHKFENAHNAFSDIKATAACFYELVLRGVIKIDDKNNIIS